MAISDTGKNPQKRVTTTKYYLRPNGSAIINIAQGFDIGLEQGEKLIAQWDGSRIILVPLKKVKFE